MGRLSCKTYRSSWRIREVRIGRIKKKRIVVVGSSSKLGLINNKLEAAPTNSIINSLEAVGANFDLIIAILKIIARKSLGIITLTIITVIACLIIKTSITAIRGAIEIIKIAIRTANSACLTG